ncbi:unnamed protein product [Laminaria digitata]
MGGCHRIYMVLYWCISRFFTEVGGGVVVLFSRIRRVLGRFGLILRFSACGSGGWMAQPAKRDVSRNTNPRSACHEHAQWRRNLCTTCKNERYYNNGSHAPFTCHQQCNRFAWASSLLFAEILGAGRERVGHKGVVYLFRVTPARVCHGRSL